GRPAASSASGPPATTVSISTVSPERTRSTGGVRGSKYPHVTVLGEGLRRCVTSAACPGPTPRSNATKDAGKMTVVDFFIWPPTTQDSTSTCKYAGFCNFDDRNFSFAARCK